MKKSMIIMLAVGAWSYSSAQDTVSSNQPARTAGSQMELTPSYFLNKAAKLSALEIEAGQLAQQKAQSADVKAYGSRMVKDHTESSDQLKALATRKNITLSMARKGQTWPAQRADVSTGATKAGTTASTGEKSTAGTGTTATARTSTGNENVNANTSGQYAVHADTGKHAGHHQDRLNQLRQSTGANFDREYMTMMVKDHTKAIGLFEKGAELDDADIKAFAAQTLPVLRDHLASAQTILNTLASANR